MDTKLRFTPNGQFLICENVYQVEIWHLPGRRLLLRDDGKLIGIANSGHSVLLESPEQKVRVYDPVAETYSPLEKVSPLDYLMGARCLLRAKQSLIQVVDALSGSEVVTVPLSELIGTTSLHPSISAACLSPDGNFFALCLAGDSMFGEWARGYCLNLSGKVHFEFSVNTAAPKPMLQMVGHYLVAESAAAQRALWDVPTGAMQQTFLVGREAGAFAAVNEAEAPPVIAVHMAHRRVTISQAGHWLSTVDLQHEIKAAAFYPNNRHLAVFQEHREIAFYDWRSGSYKGSFRIK